jgi:dihydrofolate synthase/folylpolyglutamate synthase
LWDFSARNKGSVPPSDSNYGEALSRLYARGRFGMRPGLERIRSMVSALGHPERSYPVLLIGGTNGKGSTAAMAERILREAGQRTGLYTSPHLLRFTERIRIGGEEVADEVAARHLERALSLSQEATYFEVATAAAFDAFAAARVDVAVVEVGLGGRHDATNVVDATVAVVTQVALDHTDVLGTTVREIAADKAGIFRPDVPAVFGARDVEAAGVLREAAGRCEALPFEIGHDFDLTMGTFEGATGGEYRGPGGEGRFPLALAGRHQLDNAALALCATALLPERFRPTPEARRRGLLESRWPGRLEWIGDVLFDGAHNPNGARALAAALVEIGNGRPVTLVLGVLLEKDAEGLIEALQPVVADAILTRPSSPRARSPELLRAMWPAAEVVEEPARALDRARDRARSRAGFVVVAGSLFLVGELRGRLLGERADPLLGQESMTGR